MPVEIKELIIRAVVEKERDTSAHAPRPRSSSESDEKALVESCVQQVLRILKKSKER